VLITIPENRLLSIRLLPQQVFGVVARVVLFL
jgi:hypothetical protein